MRIESINIPDTLAAAFAVICGKYGVDPERKDNLKKDGYDPLQVQKCVNDIYPVLKKWGAV